MLILFTTTMHCRTLPYRVPWLPLRQLLPPSAVAAAGTSLGRYRLNVWTSLLPESRCKQIDHLPGSNGEQGRVAHLVKGGLYRRKRLQLPVRVSYRAGSLQYHTQSWISVCTAKHHMAHLAHSCLAAHCRNLHVECQEEGRVRVLQLCVDPTLR